LAVCMGVPRMCLSVKPFPIWAMQTRNDPTIPGWPSYPNRSTKRQMVVENGDFHFALLVRTPSAQWVCEDGRGKAF
jgi:hypothetical protein